MSRCYSPIKVDLVRKPGQPKFILVDCGRCPYCDLKRIKEWTNRCILEAKFSNNYFFVTLTYNNENLNANSETGEVELSVREHQLFMKRLRDYYKRNEDKVLPYQKKPLRFVMCGEYGGLNDRPHYHYILFNVPILNGKVHEPLYDAVEHAWQKKGYVKVEKVRSDGVFNYVAAYILQTRGRNAKNLRQKAFFRTSRKPGIGVEYCDKYRDYHQSDITATQMVMGAGQFATLPKLFKKKLISESQLPNFNQVIIENGEKHAKKQSDYYLKCKIPMEDHEKHLRNAEFLKIGHKLKTKKRKSL